MIPVDQIINRISEHHLLDPSGSVSADTELLESGMIDSLGVVALVAWLEDTSGLEIDPIDIVVENFETPASIAGLIERAAAA